jgi:type IV pilus assembly protein PilC
MDYTYIAYTKNKQLVQGKLSASNEEAAAKLLSYGGYQLVSLKTYVPFFNLDKLLASFRRVKSTEIIMFSRQLALLLESGADIVTSLELLQSQVTNHTLQRVIGEVASDIRGGSSLSGALQKHPRLFSQIFHRAISAGERGGNLEVVLRQMADYIERGFTTQKRIKNALTYPAIVAFVASIVIIILITFVLPTFTVLYTGFGVELPATTRLLLSLTDWFSSYGLYLIVGMVAVAGLGLFYIRTEKGKYQWDSLSLRLPIVGRLLLLGELSRICRTMSLLFRVGLPLPEILTLAIEGTTNKAMNEALTGVQHELIRGEGLSKPMAKRPLFLPLMVQMIGVGEETGKLDNTLSIVAQSYEMEADDKTTAAIGFIQPAVTVGIGIVIAFIAMALVSAMYSIYGELSL